MWNLLQQWVELREQHDKEIDKLEEKAKEQAPKGTKEQLREYYKAQNFPKRGLYVYAHNGSKFDAIAAIHSILANSDDVPKDQLESNGKFISFTWKGLIFRDSCLITMSSLSSACTAWGLETSKGYLPHKYLQNCKDANEVLSRLHGRTTWKALKPYMEWFGDADDTELHTRRAGRLVIFKKLLEEVGPDQLSLKTLFAVLKNAGFELTKDQRDEMRMISSLKGYEQSLNRFDWEDWRDQQTVYKFWKENQDVEFSFLELHDEYLAKDVDALWELCDRMGTAFARDFGSDIRTKCTLGSNAEHIWMHTLMKPIPKLQTKEQHDRWQRANRGGFCGALSQYDFTAPEGHKIYKVDITSLYPASSCPIKFETEAGIQEPIREWYCGFPDASDGWLLRDFGGVEMTRNHYYQLSSMHGLIRVEFDQNSLAFPFFLKKMEHKTFQTLAPVMQGEERFIIPHVRMAFDMGVKIKLFDCEYTTKTREVYQEYMAYFRKIKNDADAVIKELLKIPKDQRTQQQKHTLIKAVYERTVAKLFLNGLLGRNNMKIERPQTLLTRDYNDIVCLSADDEAFKGVDISEIKCGDEGWCYRAKFKEGDYADHVQAFNVCPYISAYMLGYSKMLMQGSFQHLSKIGAKLLYTDTDSIAFSATPEQWKAYSDRFVPMKKTFGGMELEGEYRRLVTIGPKKYACIKDNGTYEWACNGLPARHNTQTDVLGKYLQVLNKEVVLAEYFSINATTDFRLLHTTGASKKLRFISLKGAVEDGSIRWWKTEDEFREYASNITVVGWEDFTQAQSVDTIEDKSLDTIEELPKPSEPQNRPKRKFEGYNPTQEEQQSFVYVLTDAKGRGWSYVGYSNDPVGRLMKHNSNVGDAITTSGEQWIIYSIYEGFADRQNALRFEGLLKMHIVASVEDFEGIANKIISEKSEYSTVYKKS
jgi:predicted GIY-YIG superfamily endonuclease